MTDTDLPPEPPFPSGPPSPASSGGDPANPDGKAEARAAEAAAIRRRWITLGEALAVIAVLISGLTLWNSWSERSDANVKKSVEARQASRRAATLVLTAATSGEHRLALKPSSGEQSVQSQTITFPTELGTAPVDTTGEPRIEAAWFDRALTDARERAGLPDSSRGDERLPVVIATRFLVGGEAYEDVAVYDIGYTVSGRWLSGHRIALRGISLVSRTTRQKARALLDVRWSRTIPRK